MNHLEEIYLRLKSRSITIMEFEKSIYECHEVENYLSSDDYLELISLDYNSKFAMNEIEKILEKYIDYVTFYREKLLMMLDIVYRKEKRTPIILMEFYDMYCHGCDFLQKLGLEYGLTCVVPPSANDWDDLNIAQKENLVDSFYPRICDSVIEVKEWLNSNIVQLEGYNERKRRYIVVDNRLSNFN